MSQTNHSRRAIIGAAAGVAASVAGCLGQGSDSGSESPNAEDDTPSEASCDGIDGEMDSILPDTDTYSMGTTETFTEDAPFGIRSVIAVYPEIDDGRYEFLIIEFEDAETARNSRDEILTGNDFAQTGYVFVGKYFVGVGGPEQEPIRSLMDASSLDSACIGELQFA